VTLDWIAFFLLGLGLLSPLGPAGSWLERPADLGAGLVALAAAVWCARRRPAGMVAGLLVAAAVVIGALAPLRLVASAGAVGPHALGLWAYLLGLGFLAWRAMALLAASAVLSKPVDRLLALAVPLLFGAWLITLWQVLVSGFGVPRVLLPAPSASVGGVSGTTATMEADV
jgi:NitT/TauT family transport system permease protein